MHRALLAVGLVLLAASATAKDLYVPLGGATELQIVNPSASRTEVAIEILGGKTVRIVLDAGQTALWSEQSAEGALRISVDAAVQVTAVRRCPACSASASIPVLDVRHAIEEGELPARSRANDPAWRSGIIVVNPDPGPVVLTMPQGSMIIPGGGMRRISREVSERLPFSATAPLLLFTYDDNERSGARVFTAVQPHATKRRRRAVRSAPAPDPPPPPPQTVVLTPSKDNTLFQSVDGTISNGAGIHLFSGATGRQDLRRAMVAFDVAAQVPPGSRITRATLTLRVSLTVAGPEPVSLHPVTADWGQGISNAGSSRDGTGALARTGDATWIHTFSPDRRWASEGGDFAPIADATLAVGSGTPVWQSSDAMIARVQGWLDQPATNFGWLLLGNEQKASTAKRFDSREVTPETSRPSLTIEFQR